MCQAARRGRWNRKCAVIWCLARALAAQRGAGCVYGLGCVLGAGVGGCLVGWSLECGAGLTHSFSPLHPYVQVTGAPPPSPADITALAASQGLAEHRVLRSQPPHLYVVQKREHGRGCGADGRPVEQLYCLDGVAYMCPSAGAVVGSRITRAAFHLSGAKTGGRAGLGDAGLSCDEENYGGLRRRRHSPGAVVRRRLCQPECVRVCCPREQRCLLTRRPFYLPVLIACRGAIVAVGRGRRGWLDGVAVGRARGGGRERRCGRAT